MSDLTTFTKKTEENAKLNNERFRLDPSATIEFYVIEHKDGDFVYRFHAGSNGVKRTVIWQGEKYNAMSCDASGFEYKGDGKLPRPKITITNFEGMISQIMRDNKDLVGSTFIRKKTFLRFLDKENFENNINPFGVEDSNVYYDDEIYTINRKSAEDKNEVEFELTSALDMENLYLPNRIAMSNYCPALYRGIGCMYNGAPVADLYDKTFSDGYGLNLRLAAVSSWSPEVAYNEGQYVISNADSKVILESNHPEYDQQRRIYYVCVKSYADNEASQDKDPAFNREHWQPDHCSKTLNGCKLRFNTMNLPFNGFPGMERFPY